MANKYCNLDGSKKIKDEFKKINVGFDKVEKDVADIIVTPAEGVSEQEIIQARKGKSTLGVRLDATDDKVSRNHQTLDSKINTTKDILDNRIDQIIVTPSGISQQEIIDARQGKPSLGANLTSIKNDLMTHKEEYARLTYTKFKNLLGVHNKISSVISSPVGDGIAFTTDGGIGSVINRKNIELIEGNVYFLKINWGSDTTPNINMIRAFYGAIMNGTVLQSNPTNTENSTIFTFTSPHTDIVALVGRNNVANSNYHHVSSIIVNLTEIYGEGNEPSEIEFNNFLLQNIEDSYFSNTLGINKLQEIEFNHISKRVDKLEDGDKVDGFITSAPLNFYPQPPKLDTRFTDSVVAYTDKILGEIIPLYGSGNTFIGKRRGVASICYSSDGGASFEEIPIVGLGTLMWVAETNYKGTKAILITTMLDGVYKLYYTSKIEDEFTSVEYKFTLASGQFSLHYGRSIRNNVVCVTSYGMMNGVNPPRHLYISRDGGISWSEQEVETINNMVNPSDFHTHDVEYDPFTDRIWVSNGDRANSALRYSDDFGETWTLIDGHGGFSAGQPTNIIALADRVLFGSDSIKNGFYCYVKDLKEKKAVVTKTDIQHIYSPDLLSELDSVVNVAVKSHHSVDNAIGEYPYKLFSFFQGSAKAPTRILLTGDGVRFYEVWKDIDEIGEYIGVTANSMYGPYFDSVTNEEILMAACTHPTKGSILMKAKVPKWITNK